MRSGMEAGAGWMRTTVLALLAAGTLLAGAPELAAMEPAEHVRGSDAPTFRAGYTLPPLTRFGWTLDYETRVALCERFGYALEFGGYATMKSVEQALEDPESVGGRILALTASDPARYPLAVICSRELPKDAPDETWTRTGDGKFVSGNGEIWEPGREGKKLRKIWSPEAPDAVLEEAGRLRADPLKRLRERAPIAIVLNGGEYALSVVGAHKKIWEQDPRVLEAKGDRSWYAYISASKARQEKIITEAVRAAAPDRQLYIYYTCGGGTHRNRYGGWNKWCWGYEWMRGVSDLPSDESYYQHFNSGWTGGRDMLTMILNAKAFEIAHGDPLSYNWLCAGWPRKQDGLGDLAIYQGYVKVLYTTGMVGANAGYYAYPKGGFDAPFPEDAPPHWLGQMLALGRGHALFSWLEPFLREGDLLPGPAKHVWSKDQAAYEFPTGDKAVRVVARKLQNRPHWLVTAWAAGGEDATVTVTIPVLGEVTLDARPAGSVYHATRTDDGAVLDLLDTDPLRPTAETDKLAALAELLTDKDD